MMQPAPHSGSTPPGGGDARDDFMIVRPELVRRVGAAGALIIAALEYRCQIAGIDRVEDEAGRWWRVAQHGLAESTGLSRDTVKRELRKLVSADEIEVAKHHLNGVSDQTVSYRKLLQPAIGRNRPMDSAESHNDSSGVGRNRPIECAESPNHHWAESPNVPLFKELQEGVGRADGPEVVSPAAEVAPPVHCSKHIDNPTTDPCRGCGDARRERERWELEQATAAKVAISARARQRAELLAEAIDECDLCDERGYLGIVPCEHNPERPEINRRGMAQVRAVLDAKRKAG